MGDFVLKYSVPVSKAINMDKVKRATQIAVRMRELK
jgi:hypothetical protein